MVWFGLAGKGREIDEEREVMKIGSEGCLADKGKRKVGRRG